MSRDIHVLVVDDDQDICEYMELLLTQSGYLVRTCSRPEDAIPALKEQEFHVVVLDLMMPGISGMELLEEIRALDSDIGIIISTGYPTLPSAVQSLRLKASDYIQKPFKVEDFQHSLEKVLREKGLLSDPEELLLLTIGQQIRRQRQESKLTLKQVARRTGLSVSLLSQIERAESSASISSLYKISRALGCRLTDFFENY